MHLGPATRAVLAVMNLNLFYDTVVAGMHLDPAFHVALVAMNLNDVVAEMNLGPAFHAVSVAMYQSQFSDVVVVGMHLDPVVLVDVVEKDLGQVCHFVFRSRHHVEAKYAGHSDVYQIHCVNDVDSVTLLPLAAASRAIPGGRTRANPLRPSPQLPDHHSLQLEVKKR